MNKARMYLFDTDADQGIKCADTERLLTVMRLRENIRGNWFPAGYGRKSFLTLCACSVFVLSSCVETFDFPELGVLKPATQGNSDWNSSVPPDLSEDKFSSSQGGQEKTVKRIVYKKVKSETLLREEGVWNLIEQSKSYDPAKAHMEARNKVNVKRRKNDSKLAAHFKPDAKSGQDGKIRVLRLDSGKGGYDDVYKDVEVAESRVVRPSNSVAGKDVLGKIASVFGGDKAGAEQAVAEKTDVVRHNIIPARKPARRHDVATVAGNGAAVSAGSTKVAGGVLPPAMPARKLKAGRSVSAADSDSADAVVSKLKAVVKTAAAQAQGVPEPKVKPKRVSSASRVKAGGQSGGRASVVSGLRAAVHQGKVRVVVDIHNETQYKTAVDRLRNVLRVKFINARLDMAPQGSLSRYSSLLGTYVVKEQSDGSVLLEVRLKGESEVVDTMVLRSDASSKHRIVIDLKK